MSRSATHGEETRVDTRGCWGGHRVEEQLVWEGCQRALEDLYMQGQCCAWLAAPPYTGTTRDSDSIEYSALNSAKASRACAAFGMALQCALEPNAMAIGAHSIHCRSDTPRAFAFSVRTRTLAGPGVVMAMQPSCQITRFSGVRRGPTFGLEDVATVPARACIVRSFGHDTSRNREQS